MFGSWKAMVIAIVRPAPAVALGRLYAFCSFAGLSASARGVELASGTPLASVTTRALQAAAANAFGHTALWFVLFALPAGAETSTASATSVTAIFFN
jgi:hypothetical protein